MTETELLEREFAILEQTPWYPDRKYDMDTIQDRLGELSEKE